MSDDIPTEEDPASVSPIRKPTMASLTVEGRMDAERNVCKIISCLRIADGRAQREHLAFGLRWSVLEAPSRASLKFVSQLSRMNPSDFSSSPSFTYFEICRTAE